MIKFFSGIILAFLLITPIVDAQVTVPKVPFSKTSEWAICFDAVASSISVVNTYAITVSVDGGTIAPIVATWSPNGNNFTAKLSLSNFPANARVIGIHNITINASGTPITLPDGTTLSPTSGTPLTHQFEVFNDSIPAFTNVRWIRN